jgi:hypothetical protein
MAKKTLRIRRQRCDNVWQITSIPTKKAPEIGAFLEQNDK